MDTAPRNGGSGKGQKTLRRPAGTCGTAARLFPLCRDRGSFGTGDCVIVSDGLLHIIDYKHGLGVLVSAEKNSQLSCYALGA